MRELGPGVITPGQNGINPSLGIVGIMKIMEITLAIGYCCAPEESVLLV